MADVLKELGEQVLNDVIEGNLKRKKLMKKKTFKGFMVALKMFVNEFNLLQTEYSILQTLLEKYEKTNASLIEENRELLAMIREYQRKLNPDACPEETRAEVDILEDIDDPDFERYMRATYGDRYLTKEQTMDHFKKQEKKKGRKAKKQETPKEKDQVIDNTDPITPTEEETSEDTSNE